MTTQHQQQTSAPKVVAMAAPKDRVPTPGRPIKWR
jgi:hypothetical protein